MLCLIMWASQTKMTKKHKLLSRLSIKVHKISVKNANPRKISNLISNSAESTWQYSISLRCLAESWFSIYWACKPITKFSSYPMASVISYSFHSIPMQTKWKTKNTHTFTSYCRNSLRNYMKWEQSFYDKSRLERFMFVYFMNICRIACAWSCLCLFFSWVWLLNWIWFQRHFNINNQHFTQTSQLFTANIK